MVNVGSQDNQINITVSSGGNTSNVNATPDMAAYYSDKSKEWATSNKIVDGVDYSSKYYANISNQSATTAQGYKEQAQEILDNTRAISDSAIDSINTSKTTALEELETITTSSLAEASAANSLIISNKTNAVNEIGTIKSDALSAVSSSKTNAISEINTTKNNALSAVNTNKTSAVTEINNYKITSVAEINSSKTGALENINTAKDEALEEIASSGGGNSANKDLSNLSEEGENKFVKTADLVEVDLDAKANTDLSNLSDNGQAKLNTKVNKTGDTMTGPLKCRGGIDLQAPGATKGETPDRAYYWGIRFNDDTNANTAGTTWQQQRLGVVECALNTDNSVSLTMNAYQNVNASGSGARFTLKTSATGDQRCSFPICTAKATTTSSAAADKVVVVVQNYLNGTSWYRVWSDGFCEQGGQISAETVTFLKTYTSVPSVLIAPSGQAASSNYNNILYSVTTTGFTMYVRHSWGGWVAYGYIN